MNLKSGTSILLIAAILIGLNVIAKKVYLRWDLTKEKQYTLSKATKDILKEIEEPVTVSAYFTTGLEPQFDKARKDFEDLLLEYNSRSGGNVVYEFKDPNSDPAIEQEALQSGIQPVQINVRESDQIKQQKAYFGALVHLGESKEPIPVIQPGAAMEYSLTTSIKKIAATNKPTIGWIQGHGEPGLDQIPQAMAALQVLYSIVPVDLTTVTEIPMTYKTVAMVKPNDTIPQSHFDMLDKYLGQGGNLLVAFDRVDGNFQTVQGVEKFTGTGPWLGQKGIDIQPVFLIDQKCGTVTTQSRQGFFTMQNQVQFPYFPLVQNFADHPIGKGLDNVFFNFASPIEWRGGADYQFTPIATASSKAGTIRPPIQFDINKRWPGQGFDRPNATIAAVVTGPLGTGTVDGRMVVVSDGDFAINGAGQQQRQLNAGNVGLLVNGIDFLSDDTGLIDLRTKGAVSRPIKEMEQSARTRYKYINFFLPIALVGLYGLFRSQRRKRKRQLTSQENYS